MVNNSVINCGLRPYPWTAHLPPIVCGGFFCCVRAFYWIDYRIIEFIGHLSFCQKRDFYDGILKKNGAWFFFSIFCGGTRKKKYIFYKTKQKKKKKKERKKKGFDLIPSLFVCHRFYRRVHTHFHVNLSTL